MLADIGHNMGQDLQASPTGDIATVTQNDKSQQRLLRRLLTNLGDYIWNLDYGAGLPAFIGQPTSPADIEAVIRAQIALEPSVATVPAPVITVQANNDTAVFFTIKYSDADTGETETLTYPLG